MGDSTGWEWGRGDGGRFGDSVMNRTWLLLLVLVLAAVALSGCASVSPAVARKGDRAVVSAGLGSCLRLLLGDVDC